MLAHLPAVEPNAAAWPGRVRLDGRWPESWRRAYSGCSGAGVDSALGEPAALPRGKLPAGNSELQAVTHMPGCAAAFRALSQKHIMETHALTVWLSMLCVCAPGETCTLGIWRSSEQCLHDSGHTSVLNPPLHAGSQFSALYHMQVLPPDVLVRRQLRGTTATAAAPAAAAATAPAGVEQVNSNLTAAAPDNTLPVNSIAALITQVRGRPPTRGPVCRQFA